MIGKTLGHYEITFPRVRGSTGVAYQAKGKKLGREAAARAHGSLPGYWSGLEKTNIVVYWFEGAVMP